MPLPDRPPSRPERPRIYLNQDGTDVLQANPTSSAIPVPNVRPLRPPNLHPRRIKVLRFTSSGIAVANLRVAVTQRIQQDGEWRDGDTSFLRVNVWRGQAEHLVDSLAKGDRVMVTGRLRQRSWDTREGDKRSVTELEADEVGASLKWATAKVERTTSVATATAPKGGSGRPSGVET